jgi:UDPglucose 6-dehydrogenase
MEAKMRVCVIGTGYVGLVTAVCLASLGHDITALDIDEDKIKTLSQGFCTIYEQGLQSLLDESLAAKKIAFTCDYQKALAHTEIVIIAVGTPSNQDGSADCANLYDCVHKIIPYCQDEMVVVTKSTVPVGTGDEIESLLKNHCKKSIRVVSNPEFLRAGMAVDDFLHPDRIIIGCNEQMPIQVLKKLYAPLIAQNIPFITMSRRSAELSKYASNVMLATKISFINQISQIAEKTGANIDEISRAMGLDKRIGPHFNQAGIGYGGSCFPKDVDALIHTAFSIGIDAPLLHATKKINHQQKLWLIKKLEHHFKHGIKELTIGILGLSFKPGTDDLRQAPSLVLIEYLIKCGAKIIAFDPVAIDAAKSLLGAYDNIGYASSVEQVCCTCDALCIVTEWPGFKELPFSKLKNTPIFDGRNIFDLTAIKEKQLCYYSVGRTSIDKRM